MPPCPAALALDSISAGVSEAEKNTTWIIHSAAIRAFDLSSSIFQVLNAVIVSILSPVKQTILHRYLSMNDFTSLALKSGPCR